MDKQKLEELISHERTIGKYFFDEQKKCFLGDAATELYIEKLEENKYKSVCYFFDGYEIFLEDKDVEIFDEPKKLPNKKQ